MKKFIMGAMLLVTTMNVCGCGWNHNCINSRSYRLGDEKTSSVGYPMVQSGCFAAQWEPRGLNRVLFNRPTIEDGEYTPTVEKELVYSGREGNTLHITYREYTWNGNARSPFFQQLYYDIGTSKSIVFQDWIINVSDSSNLGIKFNVVKEPIRLEPFYLE